MSELWKLTACEAVERLRRGEVSPLEMIDAAEARIAAVDPLVNAVPIRCFDRARADARRIMALGHAERERPGYLHGLPVVIKDLTAVKDVRWTDGSRFYADRVATRSDISVEMLEQNGAIVIGKTNTPEFGAGGNTTNDVFGTTLNPWDTRTTCGGSSGGSAVAVATGEAWLATGTDMAGSVRYPAAYCSVVGLRPSPGRVAQGPRNLCFSTWSVQGPMARNTADTALMLDAMAGEHAEDPMSLPRPERTYRDVARAAAGGMPRPLRVGWSADLGVAPLDPEVRRICEQAIRGFGHSGAAVVTDDCPDLSGANDAFYVLRNMQRVGGVGGLVRQNRAMFGPEIIHYTEKGFAQSAEQIAKAEAARGVIFHRMVQFFRSHDILATPTVIAPPYDVRMRHLMEVDGTRFNDFFAYLMLTSIVTVTTCPAISVPCGFTASGLPVGLQFVAPPRDDAGAIAAAALFEAQHDFASRVPINPRVMAA